MSPEEQVAAKKIEFYSASITSWFNTRLELDKSLLTLSAGGIGLLVTVFSSAGVKSIEGFVLYALALVSFLICTLTVLWIFRANATHLEQINSNAQQTNQELLKKLDLIAIISFGMAVLLSSSIGITLVLRSLNNTEVDMANEIKRGIVMPSHAMDSFQGVANMRTPNMIQNSFGGATAMQPQPSAASGTGSAGTGQPTNTAPASAAPAAPTASSPNQTTSGQ